ncbi:hypothetical protein ACJRO7_027834 [Eucalyptus globulus]|uniref:Thionin-like protein n=1 Tax=Eucalyptus globulus TaxID=34317 RepID=A0ABD3JWA1_EUCGL
MEAEASKKMVMIVVVGLIFSTSIVEITATDCDKLCKDYCAGSLTEGICYLICMSGCVGGDPPVPSELGYCKLGCVASTCIERLSDVKNVEADKEKAEACVDSCSENCQKSYVPH